MYDHKDLIQYESRSIISKGFVWIDRHTAISKNLVSKWPDPVKKEVWELENKPTLYQKLMGIFWRAGLRG